jgi:superfamily II DNA or RNA helicase
VITLWPKQQEVFTAARQAYIDGFRAPLIVAPCGFGKTHVFAATALSAMKRGTNVLIVAHRAELIDQISDTLTTFGVDHGFICAGRSYCIKPVMVGSIQTLHRRLQSNSLGFGLVIADEAHHYTATNSFGSVLRAFPSARLLGVTATPVRLSGEALKDVFDTMIVGPSCQELIDDGKLSPIRVWAPPTVDTRGLHIRAGDFKLEESAALVNKPAITGNAISHYKRLADGLPFVVFCVNVEHAKQTAADFTASGIDTRVIYGSMPDTERKSIVEGFRRGDFPGLASVELISEGFDIGKGEGGYIGCGICLRPTASLGWHLQSLGRCLRTHPKKSHAIIIDHVGNCQRHGLPSDEREWSLEGKGPKRRGVKQEVRIRTCHKCFAAMGLEAKECSECGYVFEVKGRQVIEREGELVEFQRRKRIVEEHYARTLQEFIALGIKRGYRYPIQWAKIRMQYRERRRIAL